MTLTLRWINQLSAGALATVLIGACTAHAENVIVTDENRELFSNVYKVIQSLDGVVDICSDDQADVAVDHKALTDAYEASHALDLARPVIASVIKVQPDLRQALDAEVENELVTFKETLGVFDSCGAMFEGMVNDLAPPDVDAFMQAFADGIDLDHVSSQPVQLKKKLAEDDDQPEERQLQSGNLAEAPLPADVELVSITNGNFEHFSEVYNAVGAVDWFSVTCAEEAPERAEQYRDIVASLVPDERLGQIRAILDGTIQAQPEIKADLDVFLDQQVSLLQLSFGPAMPPICETAFESLVVPHIEKLPDTSTFSQTLASSSVLEPQGDGDAADAQSTFIYAKKPYFVPSPYHMYWEADFEVVDQDELAQKGIRLGDDMGKLRYIAPSPDGMTIAGAFKTSGGGDYGGAIAFQSSTLYFASDGRFSTHSGGGVLAGIVSTGFGSQGEGSYRISGYTLDLQYDDGQTDRIQFFPYRRNIFWEGDNDRVSYLNVGGRVYYPVSD